MLSLAMGRCPGRCRCGHFIHVGAMHTKAAWLFSCPSGANAEMNDFAAKTCTDVTWLIGSTIELLRDACRELAWRRAICGLQRSGSIRSAVPLPKPATRAEPTHGLLRVNMLKKLAVLVDTMGYLVYIEHVRMLDEWIQMAFIPTIAWSPDFKPETRQVTRRFFKRARDVGLGWHEYREKT